MAVGLGDVLCVELLVWRPSFMIPPLPVQHSVHLAFDFAGGVGIPSARVDLLRTWRCAFLSPRSLSCRSKHLGRVVAGKVSAILPRVWLRPSIVRSRVHVRCGELQLLLAFLLLQLISNLCKRTREGSYPGLRIGRRQSERGCLFVSRGLSSMNFFPLTSHCSLSHKIMSRSSWLSRAELDYSSAHEKQDTESLRPLLPLAPRRVRLLSLRSTPQVPHRLSAALLLILLPLITFTSYLLLHPSPRQLSRTPSALSFTGRDVEPDVPPFEPFTSFPSLLSSLDARLSAAGLESTSFPCALSPADVTRFDHLRTRGPTLLALNLFNNEHVLPTLSRTILSLAEFLGRDKVVVSIYENGSEDRTVVGLEHLAAALSGAGVNHTILSSDAKTEWEVRLFHPFLSNPH